MITNSLTGRIEPVALCVAVQGSQALQAIDLARSELREPLIDIRVRHWRYAAS